MFVSNLKDLPASASPIQIICMKTTLACDKLLLSKTIRKLWNKIILKNKQRTGEVRCEWSSVSRAKRMTYPVLLKAQEPRKRLKVKISWIYNL